LEVSSGARSHDETAANAIVAGGYGLQRIASHLIRKTPGPELPLNTSFALLGQRYVVDSHVFSNVVYDRTQSRRMLPNPLDVAFAALGSDSALPLLVTISQTLEEMAEYELQGTTFTAAHMAFVNQTVNWTRGCGSPESYGWYWRSSSEVGKG